MTEEFRPIPGYPNYEASSLGRIRRCVGGRGAGKGRCLSPKPHKYGYELYGLSHSDRVKYESGHRLVCLAFHGLPPDDNSQAAHEDGNPRNNVPGNLSWKTPTANAADKIKHGTHIDGERHHNAKLTREAVAELRTLRAQGWTFKRLGERFGVSPSNAYSAASGKQWASV